MLQRTVRAEGLVSIVQPPRVSLDIIDVPRLCGMLFVDHGILVPISLSARPNLLSCSAAAYKRLYAHAATQAASTHRASRRSVTAMPVRRQALKTHTCELRELLLCVRELYLASASSSLMVLSLHSQACTLMRCCGCCCQYIVDAAEGSMPLMFATQEPDFATGRAVIGA